MTFISAGPVPVATDSEVYVAHWFSFELIKAKCFGFYCTPLLYLRIADEISSVPTLARSVNPTTNEYMSIANNKISTTMF